jgi:hypothetical protein
MSASRSAVHRLLSTAALSRPHCSDLRSLTQQSPASLLLRRTSHALSLSLSSATQKEEDDVKSSASGSSITRLKDVFQTGNNELHPDGIDSTLFEKINSEYEAASSDHFGDPWHSGPSQLLSRLLKKDIKDATKTLQELKTLDTDIEHRLEYAQAAEQCAILGDFRGCMAWLDVVPNFYTIVFSIHSVPEADQAYDHIASTLYGLIEGSAEPYVVCLGLLKAVSKGYLQANYQTINAIYRTLGWILRHGKIANQEEDHEWPWRMWKSFVKAATTAKASGTPSTSKVTLNDDILDSDLSWLLSRMYNGGVRSLALSGRYEAALLWVQNSESFQVDAPKSGTKLQRFTWRLFLEEVLDSGSPASAQVRSQAGALSAKLHDVGTKGAKLLQEMLVLTLDKYAGDINEEGTLDDRVNAMLEEGDVRGSIAVLQQALGDVLPAPRWGHLPGAIFLANVKKAVLATNNSVLEEEWRHYLEELEKSKGTKGLSSLSHMVQLSHDEKMKECVAYCISTYQARDVEELALLVDEDYFKTVIETSGRSHKLRYSKYASYIAIKNLVYLCKSDYTKMHKLYQAWLEVAKHHVKESDLKASSSIETSTGESVFEDTILEYLFSGKADLSGLESESPIVSYKTPPTARPSISYFNHFLKMLPRALAITTRQGKSGIHSTGLESQVVNLAFSIIQEVKRFGLEPTASTWSILLSLLAQNVNAIVPVQTHEIQERKSRQGEMMTDEGEDEDVFSGQSLKPKEYEEQWSRIWRLTSALGMGVDLNNSSKRSNLLKATAITYAELIYGFLLVPHSRGGPCVEEANKVKTWLQADTDMLQNLDQNTKKRINKILGILEKEQSSPEERESFDLKKRSGHVIEMEERLKVPATI